jgi:TraY domain
MSAEIPPNNGSPRVTLTLDQPLYRQLSDDARTSERSLAAEVRHRLRTALGQPPRREPLSSTR